VIVVCGEQHDWHRGAAQAPGDPQAAEPGATTTTDGVTRGPSQNGLQEHPLAPLVTSCGLCELERR